MAEVAPGRKRRVRGSLTNDVEKDRAVRGGYLADLPEGESPSEETMDRMRRDFVAALVQLPAFQSGFRESIEQAALELEQAIA
jgi:hypothetical protein